MSASSRFIRRPASLPDVLTPLLGRVQESKRLIEMVHDPAYRLITVTGSGGVGKTRLAVHIAWSVVDAFEDDVVFVPLASIREPHLAVVAIGQALGLYSDRTDDYEELLIDKLPDSPLLLVLDNLEQVLGVAPVLAQIIVHRPQTTILATSQAPLGINGEQLFPLYPLPTPSGEDHDTSAILQSDSVALFIQRAHAVNPELKIDERNATAIADICRKLDGLPLAIELAAARINILSPDALLARLSNRLQILGGERQDVPDRLRTMRHAITWSYELLNGGEQELFRRLVVFSGGFSLDAVEAMFEPAPDGRNAYDVLAMLVDRSLVHSRPRVNGEARFLILETLRDFGLEQLEQQGETHAARSAHAAYILDLAEKAEPQLIGPEQNTWLDHLDVEAENIRSAVEWTLEHGQFDIALRICGAIWRFFAIRGMLADARIWLKRALASQGDGLIPYRTKALVGAGYLAEDLSDYAAAQQYFEQARYLAAATGAKADESRALVGLGTVAHDQGDYATAFEFHEQAVGLAREAGDRRLIGISLGNVGAVSYYRGNLDEALRYWEESVAILAELGDTVSESSAAGNIGAVAIEQGDYDRAERYILHSLNLQRGLNSQRDIPYTLINLADVARVQGDYTLAHDSLAEALILLREYGNTTIEGVAMTGCSRLALAEGDIPGSASFLLESMKHFASLENLNGIVENVDQLALICSRNGNHEIAVELISAAQATLAAQDARHSPVKVRQMAEIEAVAREVLTEEQFRTSLETGSEYTLETLTKRVEIVSREIAGRRHITPVMDGAPERSVPLVEHNLTGRELEILQLLAQGKSTKEISEALFISPRTTATHINNVLGKLDVSSRTAAVALAMRSGLV